MKIVINRCYGGFSISKECCKFMAARGNKQAAAELLECNQSKDKHWYGYGYCSKGGFSDGYNREDPDLIAAVEELGSKKASGGLSNLVIVEIPDGIQYQIDEYDGQESIHEQHRSW